MRDSSIGSKQPVRNGASRNCFPGQARRTPAALRVAWKASIRLRSQLMHVRGLNCGDGVESLVVSCWAEAEGALRCDRHAAARWRESRDWVRARPDLGSAGPGNFRGRANAKVETLTFAILSDRLECLGLVTLCAPAIRRR